MAFDIGQANDIITVTTENAKWKVLWREGKKVESIKQLRGDSGLGLKEAKDICEYYGERYAGRSPQPDQVAAGVKTTTLQLPDVLGKLVVIDNGSFATVIHVTETPMGINIPSDRLIGEVAKISARIGLAAGN